VARRVGDNDQVSGLRRNIPGTLLQAGMGNKKTVMAQADVDIQRVAFTEDAGRRLEMAVIPTGNLQIFKIFRKQAGKMDS